MKVEIVAKAIKQAQLEITYAIKVRNTGEIEGTAKVVENIPSGYEVVTKTNTLSTQNTENIQNTGNTGNAQSDKNAQNTGNVQKVGNTQDKSNTQQTENS